MAGSYNVGGFLEHARSLVSAGHTVQSDEPPSLWPDGAKFGRAGAHCLPLASLQAKDPSLRTAVSLAGSRRAVRALSANSFNMQLLAAIEAATP